MNHLTLFDTRIDAATQKEFDTAIQKTFTQPGFHHIITINPEILLLARTQSNYRKIINGASFVIPDGVAVSSYVRLTTKHSVERYTGVNLVESLLNSNTSKSVILVILPQSSMTTPTAVEDYLHVCRVEKSSVHTLTTHGKLLTSKSLEEIESATRLRDNIIILCALGAPDQEKFIAAVKSAIIHKHKNASILAVGIGGAFDFLTGAVKRAPRWMQHCGIEWLFRLIQEPRYRFVRIYKAVILFPLTVIATRFGIIPQIYK